MTHRSRKNRAPVRFFRSVAMQARFWFLTLVVIATAVAVLFLVISRSQNQDFIKVSLDEKSEISQLQQIGSRDYTQLGGSSLRVAIAGVLSPTKTLEHYQELLAYMGRNLGQPVRLILKPTYAEINDLVRGQRADVAFICSLAYVKGNQDFGIELLVAPQMYGETVYYSYLIVSEENNAMNLMDLRGASFAFTDPMSNSGHLAPSYQLSLLGETPISFFSRYIFTYSHDNSITAVADKLLDSAAVDSLVYDQLVADKPELASKAKIIARWGPYGIPPVVISPILDSQLKQQLRDFFLDLHKSDEGKTILDNLDIDKFVIASEDMYDSIREMQMRLGW